MEYGKLMDKENSFIVELIEDIVTGELLLPIPEAILSDTGWYEGMDLSIEVEGNELIIREPNENHDY